MKLQQITNAWSSTINHHMPSRRFALLSTEANVLYFTPRTTTLVGNVGNVDDLDGDSDPW